MFVMNMFGVNIVKMCCKVSILKDGFVAYLLKSFIFSILLNLDAEFFFSMRKMVLMKSPSSLCESTIAFLSSNSWMWFVAKAIASGNLTISGWLLTTGKVL